MNFKNYFVSNSFSKSLIPLYCKINNDDIKNIVEFIISKTVIFSCIDNFSMNGVFSFVEKLVDYISHNIDSSLTKLNDFSNKLVYDLLLKRFNLNNDFDNDNLKELIKYMIKNMRLKKYKFNLDNAWDRGYIEVYYKSIDGNVDALYKRYISLDMDVRDIYDYCLINCVEDTSIDETFEKVMIKLPKYEDISSKLVLGSVIGKLGILNDSNIRFENDENGQKTFVSTNGKDEIEVIKSILCDEDVFNEIIASDSAFNDRWIPYFSFNILEKDENIEKIFRYKNLYIPYVSFDKRNDVSLMKKCITGEVVIPKDIVYLVGEKVLNDIEFISLLIIKIKDQDFEFYKEGADSITGSSMAYGKILGRDVLKNDKFWNLLNSRIKLLNKKYALSIPVFDIDREMILVDKYFEDIREN